MRRIPQSGSVPQTTSSSSGFVRIGGNETVVYGFNDGRSSGSNVAAVNDKKRLKKVVDKEKERPKKRAPIYDISDDEINFSDDDELLTRKQRSPIEGLIKKKKIRVDGSETLAAPTSSLPLGNHDGGNPSASKKLWSRDKCLPPGLIEKAKIPGHSTSGGNSSNGVPSSRPQQPSRPAVIDLLGGVGNSSGRGVGAGEVGKTHHTKSLKPDWLLRQEEVAREREKRTKRMDTLQALGISNPDPKAKLKTLSTHHIEHHLGQPARSAMVSTTDVVFIHESYKNHSVVMIHGCYDLQHTNHSNQLDLTGGMSPTAPDKSDSSSAQRNLYGAPQRIVPGTNGNPIDCMGSKEIVSTQPIQRVFSNSTANALTSDSKIAVSLPPSPARKKIKWADQMPNGRLWTVVYIEDTCFEAGVHKGHEALRAQAGKERWCRVETMDDEDEEDDTAGAFSCDDSVPPSLPPQSHPNSS